MKDRFSYGEGDTIEVVDEYAKEEDKEFSSMRAMICLYLDPETAKQFALPIMDPLSGVRAEPADGLHITLAYFPDVPLDRKDDVIMTAARAAQFYNSVITEPEGIAQFFVEDGEDLPYVIIVNPRDLYELHRDIMINCPVMPSYKHGFVPHITLAYASPVAEFVAPDVPQFKLVFDTLSVKFEDGERHDFKMGIGYAFRDSVSEKVEDIVPDSYSPSQPASAVPTREAITEKEEPIKMESAKTGKRMATGWREKLSSVAEAVRELLSWASYEDQSESEKAFSGSAPFMVFKDSLGSDRWLAISSNGFVDREREIVSTKALIDAVEAADKTGDRGVLKLFHVNGTDIGTCDFQAVEGRFLIESGTFYSTEIAQRAKNYFATTDEELGVSIGFAHPKDTLVNGVYTEITKIVERSVCPAWAAANPWTAFVNKGVPVDEVKSTWLKRVVGDDLANGIVERAAAATKALEGQVAFKDNSEVLKAVEVLKGLAPTDEAKSALDLVVQSFVAKAPEGDGDADDGDDDDGDAGDGQKSVDMESIEKALAPIMEAASKLAGSIESISKSVEMVQTDIKSLAERVDSVESVTKALPRGASAYRASNAPDNVTDAPPGVTNKENHPVSPVADYVDLLRNGGRSS